MIKKMTVVLCAAALSLSLFGCAASGGSSFTTETHRIGDTFAVDIPAGCESHQTAEDSLTFVPEGESVDSADDFIKISVTQGISSELADEMVHVYFADSENSGVSYSYDNMVSTELGGHPLISADETRTFSTGDKVAAKMICFAVGDDGGTGAVYSIKAQGFTDEYLDSIAESITLL